MHDAEPLILEELDRLAPRADVGALDWTNVLARGAESGRARRLALLVTIAVLAVAVPAVALSSGVRSLLGLRTGPVLGSATVLVSGPVGDASFGHVWASPSTTGGKCLFTTFDHTAVVTRVPADLRGGGGSCSVTDKRLPSASAAQPLAVDFGITRRLKGSGHNWVPPIVSGNVSPTVHAARVAVEWRGGSQPLTLHNGWFVGGGPVLYMPPLAKFPFFVVAYDRAGHEVARKKLESPTLLMLHGGWKEYAREYHAWQKRKP